MGLLPFFDMANYRELIGHILSIKFNTKFVSIFTLLITLCFTYPSLAQLINIWTKYVMFLNYNAFINFTRQYNHDKPNK